MSQLRRQFSLLRVSLRQTVAEAVPGPSALQVSVSARSPRSGPDFPYGHVTLTPCCDVP